MNRVYSMANALSRYTTYIPGSPSAFILHEELKTRDYATTLYQLFQQSSSTQTPPTYFVGPQLLVYEIDSVISSGIFSNPNLIIQTPDPSSITRYPLTFIFHLRHGFFSASQCTISDLPTLSTMASNPPNQVVPSYSSLGILWLISTQFVLGHTPHHPHTNTHPHAVPC